MSKRKLIIGAAIVVVVAAAVAAALTFYAEYSRTGVSKPTPEDITAAKNYAKGEFERMDAEAKQSAKAAVDAASSPEEKAAAYRDLANSYSRSGDQTKALEYAKLAAEADGSVDSYMMVLNMADIAGDTEASDIARQKITELGGWADEVE